MRFPYLVSIFFVILGATIKIFECLDCCFTIDSNYITDFFRVFGSNFSLLLAIYGLLLLCFRILLEKK